MKNEGGQDSRGWLLVEGDTWTFCLTSTVVV